MKKHLFSFFIISVLLCALFTIPLNSAAQCSKSGFSAGTASAPTCSNQSFNAGSGTYIRVAVTNGVHYTFTSGGPFNCDMTGYQGSTVRWHRNGAGGNGSTTWTATFTGNLDTMMNRDNCQGHDFTLSLIHI